MTNDELVAFILPWAKATHPDKYEQTLSVAKNAKTFRRYLIRLVEIRWKDADHEWKRTVPLSVLEESAITVQLRSRKTGKVLVAKGKLAEGSRTWSFQELANLMDEGDGALDMLMTVKEVFDLEVAP